MVIARSIREAKDKTGQMEKKFEIAYEKLCSTSGLPLGGFSKGLDALSKDPSGDVNDLRLAP